MPTTARRAWAFTLPVTIRWRKWPMEKTPWLMTVNGADAYVSADWYASPDQVPTWLYQAVHLTGCVEVLPDHELGPHLEMLAAKFEGWLAPKPLVDDREDDGGAAGCDEKSHCRSGA
jgi:hypothetical protein